MMVVEVDCSYNCITDCGYDAGSSGGGRKKWQH